jgi:hypothetical protein
LKSIIPIDVALTIVIDRRLTKFNQIKTPETKKQTNKQTNKQTKKQKQNKTKTKTKKKSATYVSPRSASSALRNSDS